MKYLLRISLAAITAGVLGAAYVGTAISLGGGEAIAAQFGQKEVEQSKYIAVAMPLASGYYKLLVLEQISPKRACWKENGSAPTVIDPLLVTFDFTGICGRSTDSNGYSIRVAGEDLVIRYSLTIERRGDELVLIGRARDGSGPPMLIARTQGFAEGFQKFILEPGWRFSRRAFGSKTLGHIYFTNDSFSTATAGSIPPATQPTPMPSATTVTPDTAPVTPEPKPLNLAPQQGTAPIPVPGPVDLPNLPTPVAPESSVTPAPEPTPVQGIAPPAVLPEATDPQPTQLNQPPTPSPLPPPKSPATLYKKPR